MLEPKIDAHDSELYTHTGGYADAVEGWQAFEDESVVEQFQEQGYVLIKGALNETEVRRDGWCRQRAPCHQFSCFF